MAARSSVHATSILALALISGFAQCHIDAASATKPNIVLIYADDLGWGDLSTYGHPTIRTPNLDRMAGEGLRFTHFYTANAICTPSRSSLLTGRLPVRNGMFGTWNNSANNVMTQVLHADGVGALAHSELTIPEMLAPAGYHSKLVGKWHLGIQEDNWPTSHGFDEFYGTPMMHGPNEGNQSVFPDMQVINNTKVVGRLYKDYDIHLLNVNYIRASVDYIKARATDTSAKPFFLYFAPDNTHIPLFTSPAFAGVSRRGLYGDCVEELDWGVGQILDAIRTLGIANNTFVFFSSDNGPDRRLDLCKSLPGVACDPTRGGSAGPLRGGKSTTWEGGVREPGIAWWPGTIAGEEDGVARVTTHLAWTMDLYATYAEISGAKLPAGVKYDGVSLMPILTEQVASRDALFHWRGNKLMAVRKNQFKAHFYTEGEFEWNDPPLRQHNPPILFDISQDPSERFPITAQTATYNYAQIMESLNKTAQQHIAGVEMALPVMNTCDKSVALWKPDLPVPASKPYDCCQDPCSSW